MKTEKKRRLEAAGWRETTVQELLKLSNADVQYIEIKLALSRLLRDLRKRRRLTQTRAAELLKTSKSCLARMEAGTPRFLSTCWCAGYLRWERLRGICSRLPDLLRRGLFLHTLQAFRLDGIPLGAAGAHLWARDPVSDTAQRNEQSIDQKESVRWVDAFQTTAQIARQMPQTLLLCCGDRESDPIDLYDRSTVAPANLFYLVRALHVLECGCPLVLCRFSSEPEPVVQPEPCPQKAPEDWRAPIPGGGSNVPRRRASVLECGCPLVLCRFSSEPEPVVQPEPCPLTKSARGLAHSKTWRRI